MGNEDIILKSDELHREGEKVLSECSLLDLLGEYGEVNIHGGFRYNLLLKPDIDIHLIMGAYKPEIAEELAARLTHENKFVQVTFTDHNRHNESIKKDTGRDYPDGHYIGLKYFYINRMWNIDIFMLNEEQPEVFALTDFFDNKCTSAQRREILLSKNVLVEENQSSYPAKAMYDLFITGKVNTAEEFKEYRENEKV